MERTAGQKRTAESFLYPSIDCFDRRMLEVGEGHRIYLEQSGNPEGLPVVVVHGGPGGGCSPLMRRYFDPAIYRIILFDQRGCGLSRPLAEVAANTTAHLVADMEAIRAHLGLEAWVLFGGSWGATLALIYAQAHPERVRHLVLRGVFLGERAELNWFYGGGAAMFYPELWERFCAPIPPDERADMIAAYHKRLFSGNFTHEARAGLAWSAWENALALVDPPYRPCDPPQDYARTFARLENHYFSNGCFIDEGQILRDLPRIAHLPADIIQGRLDLICPPLSAYRLAQGWPRAKLTMVQAAGHALSEPRITEALISATDHLKTQFHLPSS